MPKGVTIAQKFGEHVFNTNGSPTGFDLSNCGIVYYPDRPYFLCVMTKGNDYQDLINTIQQISKTVYSAADNNYKF